MATTLTQTATPIPESTPKDAVSSNTTIINNNNNTGYQTRWKTTKPVPVSPESFIDLLQGRTPLLKQADFIDSELCGRFAKELEPSFSPYLDTMGPTIHKVGITQFEFQAKAQEDFSNRKGDEKDRYFAAVEEVKDLHANLASITGVNLLEKVMKYIAQFVPSDWEVVIAREPDSSTTGAGSSRQYYAGAFRGINNGLPIHCDWAPYDTLTEDWIIQNVQYQAVFNLYLSDFEGGSTYVHDVQWSPEALAHRDPATYGYFPSLVEGKAEAVFKPEKGDLYFFNSRNMHHLDKTTCGNRRVGLSSFFGLLPPQNEGDKPKLIFWS
ncbi:hypothetical protein GGS20DRAFT_374723 [Poronia punctata]|nr:hypothetical protein GGS20DRAFT_374723 [Poronia punctata]